ncbi:MAG TPA: fibronectin type III domain-containing protein, partial [Thermotogota bacterium]|nr:fibronectin type III domain-containing protein [Thermotogota bacterium]
TAVSAEATFATLNNKVLRFNQAGVFQAGYDSIGEAVAAASDGDVIKAQGGDTFTNETAQIEITGLEVKITSTDERAVTLDMSGDGTRAFHLSQGASVTIENFIITNCNLPSDSPGGAVLVEGTSPQDTRLITRNSTFSNNETLGDGGAIALDGEAYFRAENTVITGNQAAVGGGVVLSASALVPFPEYPAFESRDSTISQNVATSEDVGFFTGGGGIFSMGGLVSASNTAILQNSGILGGGVYTLLSPCYLESSVVSSNTAGAIGGGILAFNPWEASYSFRCTKTVVTYNQVLSSGGMGFGGGIASSNADFRTEESTISFNTAPSDGAGGGVYLADIEDGCLWTATDTVISQNFAGNGGGIFVTDGATFCAASNVWVYGNTAEATGGGICLPDGYFLANSMEIFDNTAQEGGGIYWFRDQSSTETVASNIFTNGNPWNNPQSLGNPFSVDSSGDIHTTPEAGDPVQVYGNTANPTSHQMYFQLRKYDAPTISLKTPASGSTDLATEVSLTWEATPGTLSITSGIRSADISEYQVFFATSTSAFTTPHGTTTLKSYDVTGLGYDTTYKWKVYAVQSDGATATSSEWTFTTAERRYDQPQVAISFPAFGATGLELSIELTWNATPGEQNNASPRAVSIDEYQV